MNFFERIQVLSSLAGGHKWEQVLETGGMQAVPILEKRQKESASSPEGLTPSPRGVGAGLGRETWGWHSLTQGWFWSVCLKGAIGQTAALPRGLSIWPHEFCSVGQLVPKGQREPPGSSTSAPRRAKVGERKRNCVQM